MIIIQGEILFDYGCGFLIFIWLSSIGRRRAQGCLSIWPLSGGPIRSKDLGCSVQVSVYRSAGGWCDSGWGDGHHATRICCESLWFLKPDVSSLLEAWTRMCLFMLRLGCWVWPWYWPSNGSHSAHRVWRIHFCKCGDLVCSHVFLPDYTGLRYSVFCSMFYCSIQFSIICTRNFLLYYVPGGDFAHIELRYWIIHRRIVCEFVFPRYALIPLHCM